VRADAQVVIELHMGNKPRRPAQSFVTDEQWSLIERCWADDVKDRPDMTELSVKIRALHGSSLKMS
jgi:hypothetical protein